MSVNYPTREQFRYIFLVGLLISILAGLMEGLRIPKPSQEVSDALDWNYWGSTMSPEGQVVIWFLLIGSSAVGAIGFLLFYGWSRWLLLFAIILEIMSSPFLGLYVIRGITYGFGYLGGLLFFIPFILSFFQPCSEYFIKTKKDG